MTIMNIAQNINHLYGNSSFCQRSFNWPSFHPISERTWCNASFRRPVGQTHRLTPVCNHSIGSLVSILNASSRPLTIFFTVVAVYINSLYRSAFGSFAHVVIKDLKLIPLLANRNAPPSIVGESIRVFIKTPISHFLPRLVRSRSFGVLSWTLSMFGNRIGKKTSATENVPRAEVASVNYRFISAITSAFPKRPSGNTVLSFSTALIRNDNQAAKSTSYNVNQLHTINAVRSSVQRLLLPARTSNNIHYTVTV